MARAWQCVRVMTRPHDLLVWLGQRLPWALQGAAIALASVHLAEPRAAAAPPAPVVLRSPDVHVQMTAAPAATTVSTPTAALPAPLPVDDRMNTVCATIHRFGGLYADPLHPVVYIDSAMVNSILENQALLMRSARIVPEVRDGRTVGVRLYGMAEPTSLMRRLGFENGDTLYTINGLDVTEPQHALEAYAKLRSSRVFSVLIERHEAPRLLEFRIC